MGQSLAVWQDDEDCRWLSMLVEAMEEVARPEVRAQPCAPAVLAGLRAQLARPTLPGSHRPPVVSGRGDAILGLR
jgi:hypothetical protein